MYYGDYLKTSSLLGLQAPESATQGYEVHDETLFIIVHQVYELWFKQIIHELQSVVDIFSKDFVEEKFLSTVLSRLQRVNKIQGLLIPQLDIMETMTPMDFLEFRDLLAPASGFQSAQFRQIEIMLGPPPGLPGRRAIGGPLFDRLSQKDRDHLKKVAQSPSLLKLLDNWLARTPFLTEKDFSFWKDYRQIVEEMLEEERMDIKGHDRRGGGEDEKERAALLNNFRAKALAFESLFDKDLYQKSLEEGRRSLSQEAMLGALFILLYREHPLLSIPHMVISSLIDFDEGMTAWRYRHASMAHRMLGSKIGTGGTSGHHYLKAIADQGRVFADFLDLSSFIIPKSKLPLLPKELEKKLHFYA